MQFTRKIAQKAIKIRQKLVDPKQSKVQEYDKDRFYEINLINLTNRIDLKEFVNSILQSIICEIFITHILFNELNSSKNVVDFIPYTQSLVKPLLIDSIKNTENFSSSEFWSNFSIKEIVEIFKELTREDIFIEFESQNHTKDVVTYFYEMFLRIFNPQQKISRGIFHTPTPIVTFMVQSVNTLLKERFKYVDGLADSSILQDNTPAIKILDPATGTGTFLEGIFREIKSIFDQRNPNLSEFELKNAWNEYISKHLKNKIYGIELLSTPYILAYLKLNFLLKKTGCTSNIADYLNLRQVNTLSLKINSNTKEPEIIRGISVVIGNPPYSRSSANKGQYINQLMETYKRAVKKEKNIQPLSDDYIKFLRWAQELIEQNGWGIIALVTNHTYLTGIIHHGIRKELMRVFDSIYILDLHGSKIIHEEFPDDIDDENVFDIKQGISIVFLIKDIIPSLKRIYHYDLFGTKDYKFQWLQKYRLETVPWSDISHIKSGDPFIGSTILADTKPYDHFYSLTDIFEFYNVGGKPGDDKLLISFSAEEVIPKLKNFINENLKHKPIQELTEAKRKILNVVKDFSLNTTKIEPYNYRPFDIRWIYYDPRIWTRPVQILKKYCNSNISLLSSRIVKDKTFAHVFISNIFTDVIFLSNTSSVNCYLFPLRTVENTGYHNWNFSELYTAYLQQMGVDLVDKDSLDPLAYIYAILFSNKYRKKFNRLLKKDFPRIPFIYEPVIFNKLIIVGKKLIETHLQSNKSLVVSSIHSNIVEGDQIQANFPQFDAEYVYINPKKWFFPIKKAIWTYQIGKYQVCSKWLKDRKGRFLIEDEITDYKRMLMILETTIQLVNEIDTILEGYEFGKSN